MTAARLTTSRSVEVLEKNFAVPARKRSFFRMLAAFAVAVCTPAWAGTLQGEAFYRQRIALPPRTIFEAQLQDISRAGAPAEALGRARLDPAGPPPFRFAIAYADTAIKPGRRYSVRTTVTLQGRLHFATDRIYPVLDGGNVPLAILLVSARRTRIQGGEDARPLPARQEDARTLTGMFQYMADAALIALCADGRKLPVATEAGYKALERAYLGSRHAPGQAALVEVEGTIEARPGAEEGTPPRAALVVSRFVDIWPRKTCPATMADSPLRNTYWKLVRLGESPVETAERQREAHLIFSAAELRVSGSGGCNRIAGGFELDRGKLRLSRMASTMMACPSGMEQERRFLDSLEKAERYRIHGNNLELLDAAGAVIADFEAVALR